jgi:hypothetical protein
MISLISLISESERERERERETESIATIMHYVLYLHMQILLLPRQQPHEDG